MQEKRDFIARYPRIIASDAIGHWKLQLRLMSRLQYAFM